MRGLFFPRYAYPGYSPFYGYPSSLSYVGFPPDYGAGEEPPAAAPPEDDALVSQVQALTDEVAQLREQQAYGEPAPAAAPEPPAAEDAVPTAFVYRDGRQLEAQNYAVYGQAVWIFRGETTHKIPLADLNLEATQKLNDERGVSVVLPSKP
ncbi:MAG TPA: hypothetical protein VL523_06730 [Terriglobia bacterium]|nr:hypothetical protein [Terriglobia bacterium]